MNSDKAFTEDPHTNASDTSDPTETEMGGEKEFVFKVAVVGEYSVGKTSLVRRLLTVPIPPNAVSPNAEVDSSFPAVTPTVGTDFSSRVLYGVRVGVNVRLQFWDTAGLERYAAVHASTYRNASAILAVFDVTDRQSFEALLAKHLETAASHNPELELHHIFAIANKVDLLSEKDKSDTNVPPRGGVVTREEVQMRLFTSLPDVHYHEVSALQNKGITQLLTALCASLLDTFEGIPPPAPEDPSIRAKRSLLPAPLGDPTAKEETTRTQEETDPTEPPSAPSRKDGEVKSKETQPNSPKSPQTHPAEVQKDTNETPRATHLTLEQRRAAEKAEMENILLKRKHLNPNTASPSEFVSDTQTPVVNDTLPGLSYGADHPNKGQKAREENAMPDDDAFSPADHHSSGSSTNTGDFQRKMDGRLQVAEHGARRNAEETARRQKREQAEAKIKLKEAKKAKSKCNMFKC